MKSHKDLIKGQNLWFLLKFIIVFFLYLKLKNLEDLKENYQLENIKSNTNVTNKTNSLTPIATMKFKDFTSLDRF